MDVQLIHDWLFCRPRMVFASVCALLLFASLLLFLHVRALRNMRDTVLPLAQRFSAIEQRADLLQKHIELAELQATRRGITFAEEMRALLVPQDVAVDRVIAFLDIAGDVLKRQGKLQTISAVQVRDASVEREGMKAIPLSLEATFSSWEHAQQFLSLLLVGGLPTVGSALSDEEHALLLQRVEAENPVGVTALENFLATSLLTYALEPAITEDALLRSFTSEGFYEVVQILANDSLLRVAREALGGKLGAALEQARLWPLRFLALDTAEFASLPSQDDVTLRIGLLAYIRF